MANANLSGNSVEDDDVFSSQFAALLKPIRELTKQGCWELNIAEKLDEYIHYIQDLPIEVNVDGEQMKLDFAKAAMVVQNSVQIYSKKVENLWLLLQEVIEFLCSHGNEAENAENGQNPALRLKRGSRKRHQKGDVDLLESETLKFRKFSSKIKKKPTKDVKHLQTLPYEILHLEEIIGSTNSIKIKLYTLSDEHLGYPSDLRSNFPFDPFSFFLKIDNANSSSMLLPNVAQNLDERSTTHPVRMETDCILPNNANESREEPEDPQPNFGDWQDDRVASDDDEIPPAAMEEHGNSFNLIEEPPEKMHLRQREPPPIPANQEGKFKDPWIGMEPYSDDESTKKPCGPPIRCKIPLILQERKRKEVGKEPVRKEESITEIDEYLGRSQIVKKSALKYCQPDNEFWEDYVHFTKTTGTAIKKQFKLRPERNPAGILDESDQEEIDHDNHEGNDPDFLERSGGPDVSHDDFAPDPVSCPTGPASPTKELDESKQFFELVQQFMAEYTASAKEFVTSTESTRRVQAWHEMIQPRLREAESRRDFDIHLYGSRILDKFGSDAPVGGNCSFSKVVQQQPKNEIARFFLATLQLANAYNVEIEPQEALSLDGVQLKLLSRERHHEHIDNFNS